MFNNTNPTYIAVVGSWKAFEDWVELAAVSENLRVERSFGYAQIVGTPIRYVCVRQLRDVRGRRFLDSTYLHDARRLEDFYEIEYELKIRTLRP
jgi:hypothetical protein